jgi:alpha-D-ribose 1-methylphosphonate 5-triphosphate synthase subunit PhnG
MSADEELIEALQRDVKDKRRAALVDAYTQKPTADAISTKALEILAEEIDAIEKS